jgi:stage III sporulation protein AD
MEQMIQIAMLCVMAAMSAVVVRRGAPEFVMLLSIACVCIVMMFLMEPIRSLLHFLEELGDGGGISQQLFLPLYKTIGIAFVVKLGGDLCRDVGETALASAVDLAGSVCALSVALPLLQTVLAVIMEFMQ